MPYASATTIIATPTDQVSVPFPFLDKSHVNVQVNGDVVDPGTYIWGDSATVVLGAPLAVDDVLTVFRTTPADVAFVTFTSGPLVHEDLNEANNQLFFIMQEVADGANVAIDVAAQIIEYVDDAQDAQEAAEAASVLAEADRVSAAASAAAALEILEDMLVTSVAGRGGAVTLTSVDLTDSAATGRLLVAAASPASGRTTLELGTAAVLASNGANLNSGTSAGNLLRLDGSAKIPAVDGSQLTLIKESWLAFVTADSVGASGTKTWDNTIINEGVAELIISVVGISQSSTGTYALTLSSDNGTTPVTLVTTGAGVAATAYNIYFHLARANASSGGRPWQFMMTTTAGVAFYSISGTINGSPAGSINWARLTASSGNFDAGAGSIIGAR